MDLRDPQPSLPRSPGHSVPALPGNRSPVGGKSPISRSDSDVVITGSKPAGSAFKFVLRSRSPSPIRRAEPQPFDEKNYDRKEGVIPILEVAVDDPPYVPSSPPRCQCDGPIRCEHCHRRGIPCESENEKKEVRFYRTALLSRLWMETKDFFDECYNELIKTIQ